jgi:hypothetical protein
MCETTKLNQGENRILSIDFFRGFTMFMLMVGLEDLFGNLVNQVSLNCSARQTMLQNSHFYCNNYSNVLVWLLFPL